jgi:CRP/FNR family transcriptional regulator
MLFCGEACDARELAELKRLATLIRFEGGQTIFSEGDVARSAFGLSHGMVRLYRLLPDGRRQVVAFAVPGDFLAMPLIDRFSFSADAIGEVGVCKFLREDLKRLIETSPNIMQLLIEFATRELQLAQDQLILLGKDSAEKRVAAFLVSWRKRSARLSPRPQAVPLPMRRRDIADLLAGTIASTATRTAVGDIDRGLTVVSLQQAPINVLLYARGGAALAGDKYQFSGTFTGLPFDFNGNDNRFGWVVGGGVDWAFTPHWSVNFEYDYYQFGHGNVMMIDQINTFAGVADVRQSVQVAKVGFNFHVWGPGW